jgi:Tfp pilus assembly protein PilN
MKPLETSICFAASLFSLKMLLYYVLLLILTIFILTIIIWLLIRKNTNLEEQNAILQEELSTMEAMISDPKAQMLEILEKTILQDKPVLFCYIKENGEKFTFDTSKNEKKV